MDDHLDVIGAIYAAIGHVDRWQRLTVGLAAKTLSPEVAHHLAVAQRAHERQVRLMDDIAVLARVHDQLAIGALVVDRDGTLLQANMAATRLLTDHAGLRLVDNRIDAMDTGEAASLHRAIAVASTGAVARDVAREPFLFVSRPNRPPLAIMVLLACDPIPPAFENEQPVVLLLFDPALVPPPGTSVLRALFGFTPREAELAALLMQGVGVEEAARMIGVTVSTARTFLASLAAKTDTHTQAALVRQLLAIPRASWHGTT